MEKIYMAVKHEKGGLGMLDDFPEGSRGYYNYKFYLDRTKAEQFAGAKIVEIPISGEAKSMLIQRRTNGQRHDFGFVIVHLSKKPRRLLLDEFYPLSAYNELQGKNPAIRSKGVATVVQLAVAEHLKTIHPRHVIKISPNLSQDARTFFTKMGLIPRNYKKPHLIEEFHAVIKRYYEQPAVRQRGKRIARRMMAK
ncbi:MAG: hypothetical protein V1644_02005 [Candidatus Micrarchaeota archaeon]